MALHVIVAKGHDADPQAALHALDAHIELFAIPGDRLGVSVPTKVIDQLGEAAIRDALAPFAHYDLWAGTWHDPD